MISVENLITLKKAIVSVPKDQRVTLVLLKQKTGLTYPTIRKYFPIFEGLINKHNKIGSIKCGKTNQTVSDDLISICKKIINIL